MVCEPNSLRSNPSVLSYSRCAVAQFEQKFGDETVLRQGRTAQATEDARDSLTKASRSNDSGFVLFNLNFGRGGHAQRSTFVVVPESS